MGTTQKGPLGLVCGAFLAISALPNIAKADSCTAKTESGSPFAVCFDPGNRLYLDSGTHGIGMGIRLRHAMLFDDEPDLTWKLSHSLATTEVGGLDSRWTGTLYAGRYLRHARDGHIVIPLGRPKKVFLPFDVGGEVEVLRMRQALSGGEIDVSPVRVAGLLDFSRTASFRRRFAIGPLGLWRTRFSPAEKRITENTVSPFTMLTANMRLEAKNGLTVFDAELTGGQAWSDIEGWHWAATGRAVLERTILAFNDRPLSLYLAGEGDTAKRELTGTVGARMAFFTRRR